MTGYKQSKVHKSKTDCKLDRILRLFLPRRPECDVSKPGVPGHVAHLRRGEAHQLQLQRSGEFQEASNTGELQK